MRKKYRVCPFEFCLDISSWTDGIICDYNYVFDPNVRLKRYFADGASGDYLSWWMRAHNLVSRAREMYSASVYKEDFLEVKRIIKGKSPRLERQLDQCNKLLLSMKRECGDWQLLEGCDGAGCRDHDRLFLYGNVYGGIPGVPGTGDGAGLLFLPPGFFKRL